MARTLLPVTVIFLAANASLSAVLIPFGVERLGGSEHTGCLLSGLGVGFLIGAPVIRALLDRVQPRNLLTASLTATAAAYFLLFTSSSLTTALPAAAAVGMFGSMSLVIPQTAMQRVIPNAVLGRVSAVFLTGEAAATLTGAAAGPFLAQAAHFTGGSHRRQPRHARRGGTDLPHRAADARDHPRATRRRPRPMTRASKAGPNTSVRRQQPRPGAAWTRWPPDPAVPDTATSRNCQQDPIDYSSDTNRNSP